MRTKHIGLTAIQESKLTALQQLRAERDKLAAENWKLRRRIAELKAALAEANTRLELKLQVRLGL